MLVWSWSSYQDPTSTAVRDGRLLSLLVPSSCHNWRTHVSAPIDKLRYGQPCIRPACSCLFGCEDAGCAFHPGLLKPVNTRPFQDQSSLQLPRLARAAAASANHTFVFAQQLLVSCVRAVAVVA